MKKMKWYELAEQRRKLLGLSQTELADELEVIQGTVGNWLNGRRTPNIDVIMKILSKLGIYYATFDKNGEIMVSDQSLDLSEQARPRIPVAGLLEFENDSLELIT